MPPASDSAPPSPSKPRCSPKKSRSRRNSVSLPVPGTRSSDRLTTTDFNPLARIISSTPYSVLWSCRPCLSAKNEDVIDGCVRKLIFASGLRILSVGAVTVEMVVAAGGMVDERDQLMRPRVVLSFCEDTTDFWDTVKWGLVIEARGGERVVLVDFRGQMEVLSGVVFGDMEPEAVMEIIIGGIW